MRHTLAMLYPLGGKFGGQFGGWTVADTLKRGHRTLNWLVLAVFLAFAPGCKRKEAEVAAPPAPAAQNADVAPVGEAANVPDSGTAQKTLELFSSHPNAYIKNNAAEAIRRWKAHDYQNAAVAFQTVLSLAHGEADRSQLLPVVGSFMKEVRAAAAKGDAGAKRAVELLNQTLGAP